MDYKKSVMDTLRSGSLRQTSRWYFVSCKLLFSLCILISIVVGIIASSLVIDTVALSLNIHRSFTLFAPLQIFWVVMLLVTTAVAWKVAKSSTILYRARHSTIILSSILISIVGGYILSLTNTNKLISDALLKNTAYYQALYVNLLQEEMTPEEMSFELLLERERIRTECFRQKGQDCLRGILKSDINP